MKPPFSRILTRTRFAPNALGQARWPTDHDGLTCSFACLLPALLICSLLVGWVSGWLTGWLLVLLRGRRGYFDGRFFADSAGCPLGRFSHWWRSVWVSVFGEGGVQTSSSLASTVLSGARNF